MQNKKNIRYIWDIYNTLYVVSQAIIVGPVIVYLLLHCFGLSFHGICWQLEKSPVENHLVYLSTNRPPGHLKKFLMNTNMHVTTMTNVNYKCNVPIIGSGVKIMWFVCKQLCLNMEQVQVESIMDVHLVFWVMLGVTGMKKYFPPECSCIL